MKIAICASMIFSEKMLDTKKELEKLGHGVLFLILPMSAQAKLKEKKKNLHYFTRMKMTQFVNSGKRLGKVMQFLC